MDAALALPFFLTNLICLKKLKICVGRKLMSFEPGKLLTYSFFVSLFTFFTFYICSGRQICLKPYLGRVKLSVGI